MQEEIAIQRLQPLLISVPDIEVWLRFDIFHDDKIYIVSVCKNNPCENGGTCVSKRLGYSCQCPPGYGGNDCTMGKFDLFVSLPSWITLKTNHSYYHVYSLDIVLL